MSLASPSAIRTVFWDLGGVILTNGWDLGQRTRVLNLFGVNLAEYEARHDAANWHWERGLSTARDFFDTTVFFAPRDFTFEQLWPQVCAQSGLLNPECFDILKAMKATGSYRIATLNNESRELNEFRLDAFGLRQHFEYFVCSGYVHDMKPAPGIYRDAIGISGLPAETALFIDDKEENCAAARALGMQAIRFLSPSQLCADLAAIGVIL